MMILRDLRYALRLLAKKPAFTALTVFVMAAGIGLSIYMFSFFHTILFKDLPFEGSETLVQVNATRNGVDNGLTNTHDFHEIRTSIKGLSEFSAYRHISLNVSGRDGTRQYNGLSVEPNIFQLTRTEPILGRAFSESENLLGAEYVVVIGYGIWQNQFGGDAQIIDKIVRINGNSHRIIGVMPDGYYFPTDAELWVPMRENVEQVPRHEAGGLEGLAHLDGTATQEEVNRQLALIMQRLEEAYPKTNKGISAYLASIPMSGTGESIAVVYSMQIVAVLILLLACINVGNLLLSRAVERGKETAIRVALGAPRFRLISQMLWESVIICTVGGVIGLLVAAWGLDVTTTVIGFFDYGMPPYWWKFGLGSFELKLFFGFVSATILATGLLPAWKNSGSDFNSVLRDGTRNALGEKAGRLSKFIVINEIFISITVLIAAALMALASYMSTHADVGADTENTLIAELQLPKEGYSSLADRIQFTEALQSGLESKLSIADVMISSALPGDYSFEPTIALEGVEYAEDGRYPTANYIVVTPGSLAKLGVALIEGRYLNSADDGLGKKTVLVTESFVSRHFPNISPIGKRLRIEETDGDIPEWLTIVGVVEHTIQGASYEDGERNPSVFRPFSQAPRDRLTVALKMRSEVAVVSRALRKTLQSIDPELPAFEIETYQTKIMRGVAPMRFISTVFLMFGAAAVFLAASGIYGVMSNTINQRTQEIAVKRALGAPDESITREFLMKGFKQLLWGGIPGLAAGSGMGVAMSSVLGTNDDALIVIAVLMTTIIGAVVMFATYLPTKRALQMEPGEALHYE